MRELNVHKVFETYNVQLDSILPLALLAQQLLQFMFEVRVVADFVTHTIVTFCYNITLAIS